MNVDKQKLGQIDGNDVIVYELKNDNGVSVKITNIGATITSIKTPDKNGKTDDIVLGFDDPKTYLDPEYLSCGFFLGATVGRYANRIAFGKFSIDSKNYELETNCGPHHLHGGSNAFYTKFWASDPFSSGKRVGVKMSYVSPNMENGYPGELTVNVVFTLTNDNELIINYQATTDKKTVVNLTNHSYFNLRAKGDILDTHVVMQADKYTERDDTNIPDGTIESVVGTPLDFKLDHKIGERVHMFDDGYDHNYVINGNHGTLRAAAEAWDDESGRKLEFFTTEPGFQFYTGHYLNGKYQRNELKFDQYCGFCFEAQHFPDSPNKPQFPSTLLKPGETYTQTTVYKFGLI
ncbi:MAG: galactose mutarotase [Bacteroidales bacterium]|nr:galactose mutarotase [Bacteroidales bacterium]